MDPASALIANLEKAILGKKQALTLAVVGLIAEGHILIEDVPGTGKSTLARAMAQSIRADFSRIQGTADLLPSDITGVSVFDEKAGEFRFMQGPLFGNIVLADELNRSTPRAQSSLLEAMNDRQITVDRVTHSLPRPFMVIATQNPLLFEGTYPLPESQLDRFLLRISLGYPDRDAEKTLLESPEPVTELKSLEPILSGEDVIKIQDEARRIHVDTTLVDYVIEVLHATRSHSDFLVGASPRAGLAWLSAARAMARIHSRDFVSPDDLKSLAIPVLAHRLVPRQTSATDSEISAELLLSILHDVHSPL